VNFLLGCFFPAPGSASSTQSQRDTAALSEFRRACSPSATVM